jgi:PilZ domain
MGSIEQRRHARVIVDFFADWGWGPECEFYDKITSLSISGCFLATRRELNSGDEIYIRWTGDRVGMINLKGAVRYQLRVMEGAPPTGAGIEFVGTSPQNEQKLQAVLGQAVSPI